ncbi:Protein FAR1-RELATED SEQUENCE 5 [Bienertia sinuspersici]
MTEDEIKGSLVGYSAETVEELYDLYTKHSTLVGFSVRKDTVRRVPKTGIVKEKYYLCSFEGKRRETKPKTPKPNVENSKKKKPKQQAITRVGCKAMIRVKKNKEGLSERQINVVKGKTIEALQKVGIRPSDSYRYLCAEAGGEEYVGGTLRDHMNFINRLKMKEIEG